MIKRVWGLNNRIDTRLPAPETIKMRTRPPCFDSNNVKATKKAARIITLKKSSRVGEGQKQPAQNC
jgi:molecular chaperone DnaK (HSP70)